MVSISIKNSVPLNISICSSTNCPILSKSFAVLISIAILLNESAKMLNDSFFSSIFVIEEKTWGAMTVFSLVVIVVYNCH